MSFIIAEFCQNHRGERRILSEMIHAAAENGATFAKIQSIWVKDLTHRERFDTGKTSADGRVEIIKRPYQPEYDRLKTLEISLEDHAFFIDECKKRNLIPFTTIFARGNVPAVSALAWPKPYVKVASYDCASAPFLRELKKRFKKIFVSTGATEDAEIEQAATELADVEKVFFHAVTKYPNSLDDCHLSRLDYLRKYSNEVGWSDHTLVQRDGIKAAKAAFALGAEYVERHFTILKADETKDGPVSITPALLKELSTFTKLSPEDRLKEVKDSIPEFNRMLGDATRELSHEERLNRDYYRGRFATHVGKDVVYNWEDRPL